MRVLWRESAPSFKGIALVCIASSTCVLCTWSPKATGKTCACVRQTGTTDDWLYVICINTKNDWQTREQITGLISWWWLSPAWYVLSTIQEYINALISNRCKPHAPDDHTMISLCSRLNVCRNHLVVRKVSKQRELSWSDSVLAYYEVAPAIG